MLLLSDPITNLSSLLSTLGRTRKHGRWHEDPVPPHPPDTDTDTDTASAIHGASQEHAATSMGPGCRGWTRCIPGDRE